LPGTSITPVYEDGAREYSQAGELTASVLSSAQTILPRARRHESRLEQSPPQELDGRYVFDNGLLRAEVLPNGTIVELSAAGSRSVVSQANVLALYRDKPKQWDAWNIDDGYQRSMRHARPTGHRVENGVLTSRFLFGNSPAEMRVALYAGEPFLRVDLETEWSRRHTLLRVENWLPVQTDAVTYGSPHGTIVRGAAGRTPQERAKFEAPGQRFAAVRDERGEGLAIFALDTYGWSARTLPGGGVQLGHSLLRGTRWPDERADIGTHRFSYAFAPFSGASTGALERAWQQFAHEPRVRLFTCEDEAVLIVACKPAEDGDGAIVRVRECNGERRAVRLRCGARMTAAVAVNALEREIGAPVRIEEESLVFDLVPYQLRSFRVRFSHEG
jgi:alpha-mannosidase